MSVPHCYCHFSVLTTMAETSYVFEFSSLASCYFCSKKTNQFSILIFVINNDFYMVSWFLWKIANRIAILWKLYSRYRLHVRFFLTDEQGTLTYDNNNTKVLTLLWCWKLKLNLNFILWKAFFVVYKYYNFFSFFIFRSKAPQSHSFSELTLENHVSI